MIKYDRGKYYFDEKAAFGVVSFIEKHCRHIKGEWAAGSNPLMKLEDWQKEDIIYPLFGIKEIGTNRRRFKYAYIELPRKNGKSSMLAAMVLVMLLFDNDPGAELYSAAASRDQAKIVFDLVKKMVQKDQLLSDRIQLYQNAVIFGDKSYKATSADVNTNHGGSSNFICFDELHAQPDRHLFDVLQTSMAAKEQPLFVMITTAGYDLNSICYEQHDYAVKVRDGVLKDERYLPVIYAADIEDDPFIEKTWKKANPNYGVSVKKEYISEQAEKARQNKAYLNTFLRLHLNIWTSVDVVWITDEKWQKCGFDITHNELIEQLKGGDCYGGLDLSSKSDITAFSLIFPPSKRDFEPNKYITLNWFWLPEEKGRDSADKNNNNYLQWVSDGWIEETAGNVIDYDFIKDRIEYICTNFNVVKFAYDPYNSTQIVAKLEEGGLPMIPFRQGFVSMNFPTLEFDVKINRRELLHNNNPVLRWMVSNGVLLSDSGGKLFKVSKNQPHQKIDGLITNIMALGLALDKEIEEEGSYLDGNDVLFVEL